MSEEVVERREREAGRKVKFIGNGSHIRFRCANGVEAQAKAMSFPGGTMTDAK
jgi:class 3 adenylate cyclase